MMTANLKRLLCVVALAILAPLSQVHADGGVIHFRGEIVEGGCDFKPQNQKVSISCYKDGKPATYHVALNQLDNYSIRSDSLVHTSIRYLDPQRRLAVMNVTYQ
jgi:type 1 fimbria pilin